MLKPRKLPEMSLEVDAPPELTYQVVSSAGKVIEDHGDTKIVDFETEVNDETVVTRERLTLHPHHLIEYEWIEGPLPHVVEEIEIRTHGDNSRMIYRGEYATARGLRSCLIGLFWVSRVFTRLVTEHLEEAKRIAEERAKKSNLFPRNEGPREDKGAS